MASLISLRYPMVLVTAILAPASWGTANAQVISDPNEINACLCLNQAVAALSAEQSTKTQTLAEARQQLADLDAQLAHERPLVNVNNADSVARYKALLERRDAAYQRSLGAIVSDTAQAVARYNARVNEYNARCAGRPFNSEMVAAIQARLSCPPLQ